MKKNYISSHNFGYGINDENLVNKIHLKNNEDVQCYIENLIEDTLYAKVKNNVVTLTSDNTKIKLFIDVV